MEKTMVRAVEAALTDFGNAYTAMMQNTMPPTPNYTQFKTFRGHSFCWPTPGAHSKQDPSAILIGDTPHLLWRILQQGPWVWAKMLVECDQYQPHRVWRDIRAIQRAAQYCRRRAEGRQRAAQEILKQQSKYWEKIKAEAVIHDLAR